MEARLAIIVSVPVMSVSAGHPRPHPLGLIFRDVLSSGTFWTAIGSLATIATVFVGVLTLRRGHSRGVQPPSARQRKVTADEAAASFDRWMKNYIHDGAYTDRQKLLQWLEQDRGWRYVGDDYETFRLTARLLVSRGYSTEVAPSEGEFRRAIAAAKAAEEAFRRRD